jgi:hypothetical protein
LDVLMKYVYAGMANFEDGHGSVDKKGEGKFCNTLLAWHAKVSLLRLLAIAQLHRLWLRWALDRLADCFQTASLSSSAFRVLIMS